MSKRKPSATRRLRVAIHDLRARQHPFVPSAGHPTLCSHCNAGEEDLHQGRFIHARG